jgi:hypothetical protein
MKFDFKFKLGHPLSWQTLISPGHGILAKVIISFPYG